MRMWPIVIGGVLAAACGGGKPGQMPAVRPQTRQTVLWVADDIGDEQVASFGRAGVSRVVVRRGTVNLESSTPVLRVVDGPVVAGGVPVAPALHIETGDRSLDAETGEVLWPGLSDALGGAPAEIVLDMPGLPQGSAAFVARLARVSGLNVVPILTAAQIATDRGIAVARSAGSCIVPLFGVGGGGLRGAGQDERVPLSDLLRPLAGSGVGVRAAIILRPQSDPPVRGWGEGLDALCEPGNVEIQRTSALGRSFIFNKEMMWSGRQWQAGEKVDIGWMDAARLNTALSELDNLMLPDVIGWDLVSLPPSGDVLGISREALFAYLEGRGPGPEVAVHGERNGRSLRVRVSNTGPFSSAVLGSGHWLEVDITEGAMAVDGRGDFDTVLLGSRRRGVWKPGIGSGADAVRFGEVFIGPGEVLQTGTIRLPSSRSKVVFRWRVVLSSGEILEGESSLQR